MVFLFQYPDGSLIRCRDAMHARELALAFLAYCAEDE